jgi:cytochrome c553
LLAVVTCNYAGAAAEPPKLDLVIPDAKMRFFEDRIRPILAEKCYNCHGQGEKIRAGLELTWKGGWEKGGDSGPPIIPGDPEKSLLIKAVRYTDPDLQMPPKGQKLSDNQIADLVAWIKMGAPDPRTTQPPPGKANVVAVGAVEYGGGSKDHWSFKPLTKPSLPSVKNDSWPRNEVDRFILAKLEENGMTPNEAADKRALIRRVYYDLIGLPPTPEQAQAFVADESPNAFEKVVDQLLASPQYGVRWGRHWLDVARYSDTKGQFDRKRESSIYPYAWTYRDYVIKAFNDDKPYDRFIFEQLAADRMPVSGTNAPPQAALGFLTLGDHFSGNMSDILNDRIDVVSKAFLGLTVSCARCHDHKFDPIPQADYYSLHGIFASCVEPMPKPEISNPKDNPNYTEYLTKRAELDQRIQEARAKNMASVFGDYKRLTGVYLYALEMPASGRDAYLTKYGADPDLMKNWQQTVKRGGRQTEAIFGLWNALARIPPARFEVQASRMLAGLGSNERARQWSPYVIQAFRGAPPRSIGEAATIYGNLFARNDPAWQSTLLVLMNDATLRVLPNRERQRFSQLREQSDMLELVHPGTPARASALADSAMPKDSPIFIRGQAETPGDVVPRRFLEILSGPTRPAFHNGSGRLELAQSIVSSPLTARVMVNRVWLHHFGEGLVTTPDDFGNQSAPPSHPELLDYLAGRFMADGWSLKRLHKLIVMSATYQQSNRNNPQYAEKDPFNRLLWRANIRRLEFEPLRDSILYLGGDLDLAIGGHPVDLSEGTHTSQRRGAAAMNRNADLRLPSAPRRTVYGFVDRGDLVEVLNTFDFANPDMPTGKRYETIVPQQALFLMNSPLVIEQVRKVVNRDDFKAQDTDEDRIRYLYDLFFQRPPSDEEIKNGKEFVATFRTTGSTGASASPLPTEVMGQANRRRGGQAKPGARVYRPLTGWQEYAHALLLTNEASFVN